jgi:hypothetical protein
MSVKDNKEKVNIDEDASIDDLINKIVQLSTLTKSIKETKEKNQK